MKKEKILFIGVLLFIFCLSVGCFGSKDEDFKTSEEIAASLTNISFEMKASGFNEEGTSEVENITYMENDKGIYIGSPESNIFYVKDTKTLYEIKNDKKILLGSGTLMEQSLLEATAIKTYLSSYSALTKAFKKDGTSTVAGRNCIKYTYSLTLSNQTVSYDYYLDKETGICMKTTLANSAVGVNKDEFSFEITKIQIGNVDLSKYINMEEGNDNPPETGDWPTETLKKYGLNISELTGAKLTNYMVHEEGSLLMMFEEASESFITTVANALFTAGVKYTDNNNENCLKEIASGSELVNPYYKTTLQGFYIYNEKVYEIFSTYDTAGKLFNLSIQPTEKIMCGEEPPKSEWPANDLSIFGFVNAELDSGKVKNVSVEDNSMAIELEEVDSAKLTAYIDELYSLGVKFTLDSSLDALVTKDKAGLFVNGVFEAYMLNYVGSLKVKITENAGNVSIYIEESSYEEYVEPSGPFRTKKEITDMLGNISFVLNTELMNAGKVEAALAITFKENDKAIYFDVGNGAVLYVKAENSIYQIKENEKALIYTGEEAEAMLQDKDSWTSVFGAYLEISSQLVKGEEVVIASRKCTDYYYHFNYAGAITNSDFYIDNETGLCLKATSVIKANDMDMTTTSEVKEIQIGNVDLDAYINLKTSEGGIDPVLGNWPTEQFESFGLINLEQLEGVGVKSFTSMFGINLFELAGITSENEAVFAKALFDAGAKYVYSYQYSYYEENTFEEAYIAEYNTFSNTTKVDDKYYSVTFTSESGTYMLMIMLSENEVAPSYDAFPTEEIEKLLGISMPAINGGTFLITSNYEGYVELSVLDITLDDAKAYYNALLELGYEGYAEESYFSLSKSSEKESISLTIDFYADSASATISYNYSVYE